MSKLPAMSGSCRCCWRHSGCSAGAIAGLPSLPPRRWWRCCWPSGHRSTACCSGWCPVSARSTRPSAGCISTASRWRCWRRWAPTGCWSERRSPAWGWGSACTPAWRWRSAWGRPLQRWRRFC